MRAGIFSLGRAAFMAAAMIAAGLTAATAQPAPEPDRPRPVVQGPHSPDGAMERALDQLLADHDYDALSAYPQKFTSQAELGYFLTWLQEGIYQGSNMYVTMTYIGAMWAIGNRPVANNPFIELKTTAGMMSIYALAVILADGPKCADPTASGQRWVQTLGATTEPLKHVAALPDDRREVMIGVALDLEQGTREFRDNDDYICRGGAAATKDSPIPDPSYRPDFVAREVWEPKQIEAISQFSQYFNGLIAQIGAAP